MMDRTGAFADFCIVGKIVQFVTEKDPDNFFHRKLQQSYENIVP